MYSSKDYIIKFTTEKYYLIKKKGKGNGMFKVDKEDFKEQK